MVTFNELKKEHLIQIVDLMLAEIIETAKEQGMTIEVDEKAKEKLADKGYDPAFGARPLRRVIEEHVEDGIADLMLEEENLKHVKVTVKNNDIVVTKM